MGHSVAADDKPSQYCNGCGEAAEEVRLQCSGCKSVRYCNRECQKGHWSQHNVLCASIQYLQKEADEKCKEACSFASHLTPKQKSKVAKVIGEKCVIHAQIDGKQADVLWDTGSQVCLASSRWMKSQGIEATIHNLSDLIGDVRLEGVGGFAVPYKGYAVLRFKVDEIEKPIEVPFLVTDENLQNPIIGYNVISALVNGDGENEVDPCEQSDRIRKIFAQSGRTVDSKSLEVLSQVLSEDSVPLSTVRVPKEGCTIKAGSVKTIPCKIDSIAVEKRTPVIFEPEDSELLPPGIELQSTIVYLKKGANTRISVVLTNTSARDLKLSGRLQLGELESTASVVPVQVQETKREVEQQHATASVTRVEVAEHDLSSKEESSHSQKEVADCDLVAVDRNKDSLSGVAQPGSPNENSRDEISDNQKEPEGLFGEEESAKSDQQYWDLIMKVDMSGLTIQQQNAARQMLWSERESFASDKEDIGCAPDLKLDINTTDEIPVQRSYNNIPRPLIQEAKKHIEDMLNRQWITKSTSAWSSPVVLVRKKDGSLRLCCDFRKLNAKTVPDKHPLPRIQSTLDSLGGSRWFSVLDQTRAYYQGFVSKKDQHKTAFVTPWGLYQWVRIPFGLTNAPAKFQRYMEETVEGFRDDYALPYLDDIIVYSKTFEEHLEHIRKVIQRTKEKGLKLNLSKCDFFKKSVKFLGRIVSEEGYKMDDENISAITALKEFIPKTVTDVRHLLGLLGYHRRHVQDFSRRAKPLTDLLQVKREKKDSKAPVEWTSECQKNLNALIDDISSPPVLAYPDFSKEFILHTDASTKGLGCILYQEQGGAMRVIGYGSRTTNAAEQNYIPAKLEFLALKWAITDVFRDYLAYADHFTAYTDNNPLVYLMETQKLNAYCQRWISELAEFNFNIKYRPGVINRDADCLSRIPLDIQKYMKACTEDVPDDAFRAIVTSIEAKTTQTETWRLQMAALRATADSEDLSDVEMNKEKLKEEQRKDADLGVIIECIETGSDSRVKPDDSPCVKTMKRCVKKLKMVDGLLMKDNQIVLPPSMRHIVYEQLHVQLGHLGSERVLDLARQRVYWPRMQEDIDEFIHKKCPCLMQKRPRIMNKAPLQSIVTTAPLELVTVDFIQLEEGRGGKKYILVIVDHFTRYAQAYATTNKSALTAAKLMYSDFILRFGIPARFLSDQGGEFENKLMQELNKLAGIVKSRTTPYHPQTNGMCERMNQTLLGMLRTLPESNKKRWPEMVNKMIHAYNSTKHSVTGYSPFFLLFGRNPRLPIDTMLGIAPEISRKSHGKFLVEWKRQMSEAYRIASERTAARKMADQKRWNERPLLSKLIVGDRVLVLNKTKDVDRVDTGVRRKLKSFWEQKIYVVTSLVGDQGVVYEVRDESCKTAKPRILHRNMLLPVSDDFVMDPVEKKKTKAKNRDLQPMQQAVEENRDLVVVDRNKDSLSGVAQPGSPNDSSSDDEDFYLLPTPVDGAVEERKKTRLPESPSEQISARDPERSHGHGKDEKKAANFDQMVVTDGSRNPVVQPELLNQSSSEDAMVVADGSSYSIVQPGAPNESLSNDEHQDGENTVQSVNRDTEAESPTNTTLEDDSDELSVANDTDVESSTSSDQSVGADRELPRALRDLADYNKRGLKEQPVHVKRQPARRHHSEGVADSTYSAESERSMNLTPGTRARKQKCMRRKEYSERLRRSRGDGVNRLRSLDVEEEVVAERPTASASDVVVTSEFTKGVDETSAEINTPGADDEESILIEETNEESMAPNEGASTSEDRQRSSRSRRPPQKFEYDQLGMPSINVVHKVPTVKSRNQRQYYDKLNTQYVQQNNNNNIQNDQYQSHNNNYRHINQHRACENTDPYLQQSDLNEQYQCSFDNNYQYIPQPRACENTNQNSSFINYNPNDRYVHQSDNFKYQNPHQSHNNHNQCIPQNTNQCSFDNRSTFCCYNSFRSMWPENLIENLTQDLMFRRYGIIS